MRTLQALDGEAAGESQREIASVIFGESDVWQRWTTNSELRAQLRYFLRCGHQLVEGGYLNLLRGSPSGTEEGEFYEQSEPP
jgi:hypothetical protein